jgi:hypothetical protein
LIYELNRLPNFDITSNFEICQALGSALAAIWQAMAPDQN